MNQRISLNLDLLRWIAAFIVFSSHMSYLGFTGLARRDYFQAFGTLGVIIFFVLSGFVVAFVADKKHPDWRDYLRARIARLYSVYIPAMVLTFVLDVVGRHFSPEIYADYPAPISSSTLPRTLIFLGFLSENSIFSVRWLSNGPMWSLAYEFWYYIIFGVVFYFRGWIRILLLSAGLLLAGWKILILFPIWLSGVLLYRYRNNILKLPSLMVNSILLTALAALAVLTWPSFFIQMAPVFRFGFSLFAVGNHSWFVYDYILLLPVIGLLIGCIRSSQEPAAQPLSRLVRWGAGFSFSLYLFHVPIILFSRALGLYDSSSLLGVACCAAAIVGVIYLLALVTEHRKKAWLALVTRFV